VVWWGVRGEKPLFVHSVFGFCSHAIFSFVSLLFSLCVYHPILFDLIFLIFYFFSIFEMISWISIVISGYM
jgi:hypothetical protein